MSVVTQGHTGLSHMISSLILKLEKLHWYTHYLLMEKCSFEVTGSCELFQCFIRGGGGPPPPGVKVVFNTQHATGYPGYTLLSAI